MFIRRRQDVGAHLNLPDSVLLRRFSSPRSLASKPLVYETTQAWTHGSLASNILSHSCNSIFKCGHPLWPLCKCSLWRHDHVPGIADRMQKELTSLSSSSMKVSGARLLSPSCCWSSSWSAPSACDQRYLYMVMPPERTFTMYRYRWSHAEGADQLELQQHEGERSRAPLTFMLLELKLVSSFCMRSAIPGTWSCRQREHLPCTGIADRMQKELTSLSSSSMKVRGAEPRSPSCCWSSSWSAPSACDQRYPVHGHAARENIYIKVTADVHTWRWSCSCVRGC